MTLAVTSINLTNNHLEYPQNFGLEFTLNSENKIICPISLKELKEGDVVIKVNGCGHVILQESYKADYNQCPRCKQQLCVMIKIMTIVSAAWVGCILGLLLAGLYNGSSDYENY